MSTAAPFETSGADRIEDTPRGNVITGLAGNDLIDAGKGDDDIDGGAGSDRLKGGRGIDTYRFGRGSGVDTIIDPFGKNRVVFGPNIVLTDLQLSFGPSGKDLAIRIAGTEDLLVVHGEFPDENAGVEFFEFDDGTVLNRAAIRALLPAVGLQLSAGLQLGTSGEDILGASGDFTIAAGLESRDTYRFNCGDGLLWIGDTDLYQWDETKPDTLNLGSA